MKRFPRRGQAARRRGLTLMEVLLAITILGLSMAAIGQLVRLGSRSGVAARELNKAQIYCQSRMAEITSGMFPVQQTPLTQYEFDPEWSYAVEVYPIDAQTGLVMARVTFEQNVPAGGRPLSYSLTRWVPDPGIEFEEEDSSSSSDSSNASNMGGAPQ